jgi:predicted N-acetyltransferase YhbS
MSRPSFTIKSEIPADKPMLDALSARCFGPGRFVRTAYRLRERGLPVPELCLTGWAGDRLAGSIRFTALCVGGEPGALLLGPLAVDPDFSGQGCGRALIAQGLEAARAAGYRLVLLVGDLAYFGKFGFKPVPPGQITLPGPVDPARLLAVELEKGALDAFSGAVARAPN